jgi:hypothetical protein
MMRARTSLCQFKGMRASQMQPPSMGSIPLPGKMSKFAMERRYEKSAEVTLPSSRRSRLKYSHVITVLVIIFIIHTIGPPTNCRAFLSLPTPSYQIEPCMLRLSVNTSQIVGYEINTSKVEYT